MYNSKLKIKAYIAPRQTGKTCRAILKWLKNPKESILLMNRVPYKFVIPKKLMIGYKIALVNDSVDLSSNISICADHELKDKYVIGGLDKNDNVFSKTMINRFFVGNDFTKMIIDEYCFYDKSTKKGIANFLREFSHQIDEITIYSTSDMLYEKNHKDIDDILFWPQTEIISIGKKWDFIEPFNFYPNQDKEAIEVLGKMFKN